MLDTAVTFEIDRNAEPAGDVLPVLAAMLIEIDERQGDKQEITAGCSGGQPVVLPGE